MSVRWTISLDGAEPVPLSDLRVQGGVLTLESLGRDTLQLTAAPSATWPEGTMVGLHLDGVRRFYGPVLLNQRDRAGNPDDRAITVVGVWYYLERCPYRQEWAVYDADELGLVPSSRVILNCQPGSATGHISVEGQLASIILYANLRGAPVDFGSAAVGLTLPFDEHRDIVCAQAIQRSLRLSPSVCSWWDYDADPPQIHFGEGDAFSPSRVERDSLGFRDDLIIPGLCIEIERVNSYNGTQYRTLEKLTAGDQEAFDTAYVSLALAGSEFSSSYRSVKVETEPVGDFQSAAWWSARHPLLAGVAVQDVTFVSAERGLLADEFPRISRTPLPDLAQAGCKARVELFQGVVDIVQRDAQGAEIGRQYDVQLELQYVTTDATSKRYRWLESFSGSSAEPAPSGLAANLLGHWSVRYAQGSFSCPLDEGVPHPGARVEATPVQRVSVDLSAFVVSGSFSPPAQLAAADFVSLMQGFRTSRRCVRFEAKETGEPPATDSVDLTFAATPVSSSAWTPGRDGRRDVIDGGKTISLNPSADLSSGETVKARALTYSVDDDESEEKHTQKVVRALLSEPLVLPRIPAGYEEREVRLFLSSEILDCHILVRKAGLVSTPYEYTDRRLLLAVEPDGEGQKLALGKGYLKA